MDSFSALAHAAGILYVAVNAPVPVSVLVMAVPPTPNVPNAPIVTSNLVLAGKLRALMVTDSLRLTAMILNTGVTNAGAGVAVTVAVAGGLTVATGVTVVTGPPALVVSR